MISIDLRSTRRQFQSRRRSLSALATLGLLAGLLAVSVGPVAATSPTLILSSSVAGTTATVAITVNRQAKAIASCMLVSDTLSTSCGSETGSTRTTTTYDVVLPDQTTGDHALTVNVILTDGGGASATISFTILDIDRDGDGVPDAVDNCPTIANADQANTYGSAKGDACEDTNGDGVLDVNEADMCVSVDGVTILASGTALCASDTSTGEPNIAVANGLNANAAALSVAGNRATAIGVSAGASAAFGSNNIATANGDDSSASALRGDSNTATASGSSASALSGFGNNNTAVATGNFASANAMNGDNNSATATGDFTFAEALAPTGCTYVAPPDGSCS